MANYISENDIEKACVEVLMNEIGYDQHLNLWQLPDDGNAAFGRRDAREVVRLGQLRANLHQLNPQASAEVIQAALIELTQSRAQLTPFAANRAVTRLLREGCDVPTRNPQELLEKLKDNETQRTILTTDWHKDEQMRHYVDKMIGDFLNDRLPDSYDKPTFKQKQKAVFNHIFNVAERGTAYWG